VHTRDAASTIARLVAVFPTDEQDMARIRLSETVQAIVSQRLLPRSDGKGRAVAAEVMIATGTIRDCIADPERIDEIRDLIAEGGPTYGMQSFDQSLMQLVRAGEVDFAVAKAAATNPGDFELQMNTLSASVVNDGYVF
jgi:twitching motility protein PilT